MTGATDRALHARFPHEPSKSTSLSLVMATKGAVGPYLARPRSPAKTSRLPFLQLLKSLSRRPHRLIDTKALIKCNNVI